MGYGADSAIVAGDTIMIAGDYRRRTFWEWLCRKPRELRVYKISGDFCTEPGAVNYLREFVPEPE